MLYNPHQDVITILRTLAAVLFLTVAGILLGRKVRSEYRRPTIMFGLWWLTGGLLVTSGLIKSVLSGYGIEVAVPMAYLTWILLPFALFCLLYYTQFLFTGSEKWIIPLAVFYGAIIVCLVAIATISGPYFNQETGTIEYVKSSLAGYAALISITAVAIPQICVCVALYILYFKLDQPTQKYRIFMIATGILIWIGAGFIGGILEITDTQTWPIISNTTVMLAGLMAYLAYDPPKPIKKRGVISIYDETNSKNGGGD